MAYTYDDFVSAATGAGMMDRFTQEDLERVRVSPEYGLSMVKLYQDYDGASTPEQKLLAQEAQNQLRRVYSGNSANPAAASQGTAQTGGSFVFDREQELKNLTDKAVNMGPFAYDRAQDKNYADARKEYLREAERARADTMAKAAAATGGTPSSFAVTAAQQAGDYHLTQLADREAALEQTAYQRYLQEYQKTLSDLDLLTGQKDTEYKLFLQQQEMEQEALSNAMSLYNTYRYTMTTDQIRALLEAAGYMTPAVEVFLQNMTVPQASGSGTLYEYGTDPVPDAVAAAIGAGMTGSAYGVSDLIAEAVKRINNGAYALANK